MIAFYKRISKDDRKLGPRSIPIIDVLHRLVKPLIIKAARNEKAFGCIISYKPVSVVIYAHSLICKSA